MPVSGLTRSCGAVLGPVLDCRKQFRQPFSVEKHLPPPYSLAVSRIELAMEKVRHLDETQADALLEWLELRENRESLRKRLDSEIDLGLAQLRRGQKIPGEEVHAEIRNRSRQRRAGQNG
jgi:predicted transcriptional regulator